MDLTPLIREPGRSVAAYVQEFITRFARDVTAQLERLEPAVGRS
jgi:hypothetical protein